MSRSGSDDYEVKRTIWESKVPVEFTIDSEFSLNAVKNSSFVMLPRVSYFTHYLSMSKLNALVNNLDDNAAENIWLQFNGKPLKWHYPVGVLYDMYLNAEDSLPWLITIKLKDFPDELIRCSSNNMIKNCFFQSLKEADHLKHRSSVTNNMTADDHSKLYDALLNDKFDDFWKVNKQLMCDDKKSKLLNIPIRFYEPSLTFRQVLIPPRKLVAPEIASSDSDDNTDNAEEDFLLSDALVKAFPEFETEILNKDDLGRKAISHGIVLPLKTPVLWLAKNLSYPDNFVHIVWR